MTVFARVVLLWGAGSEASESESLQSPAVTASFDLLGAKDEAGRGGIDLALASFEGADELEPFGRDAGADAALEEGSL